MASRGRVRMWHDEEGWGVIDSEYTPGGCWAHFSAVHVTGYKVLTRDQQVLSDFEATDQDGYAFRAVQLWPADGPARAGGPAE